MNFPLTSADLLFSGLFAVPLTYPNFPLTSADLKNVVENHTADLGGFRSHTHLPPISADLRIYGPPTFRRPPLTSPLTSPPLKGCFRPRLGAGRHTPWVQP